MEIKKLEKLVKKDFKRYNQDNPAPVSFTVNDENGIRHYELGICFGLVATYYRSEDGSSNVFEGIQVDQLSEDDCFWRAAKDPISMSSGWLKSISNTSTRMKEWLDEHTEPLYYVGMEGQPSAICGHKRFKIDTIDFNERSNEGVGFFGIEKI